jgi:hypothetical protein
MMMTMMKGKEGEARDSQQQQASNHWLKALGVSEQTFPTSKSLILFEAAGTYAKHQHDKCAVSERLPLEATIQAD